jgi:anti-sigma factor RsiW
MTAGDPGLSCQELVEVVTDYLEARLPPAARARFEAHLGECDGCVAYVEQLRQTIRVAGRARVEDVPEPARKALLEAFRGWKK